MAFLGLFLRSYTIAAKLGFTIERVADRWSFISWSANAKVGGLNLSFH